MAYQSVDKLQKTLASKVFSHTKDAKKASGRALGTLVEIITYYLLKTWGLNNFISIERGLEEYGNPEITHNIEYSLHPVMSSVNIPISKKTKSISSNIVMKALEDAGYDLDGFERKNNYLLNNGVLRNACTFATSANSFLLCSVKEEKGKNIILEIFEQARKPYAMFECKRVGVEDGMKKGPQTIEKAKQGAYVAKTASSLQKIRTESGGKYGIIYRSDGSYIIEPYIDLMEKIISSNDKELLRRFILTIGVVSNHGNWFTSGNQNKEMRVLAQSYDWLLFLTDDGLAEFIENLLLSPTKEYKLIQDTFLSSYKNGKKKNQFTKVQMNIDADAILLTYFKKNLGKIEGWFNVISPEEKSITTLKKELQELRTKDWKDIFNLPLTTFKS